MKVVLFITCLLVLLTQTVHPAKILVASTWPSYSHFQSVHHLAVELAARDNDVTVISPFPQKDAKFRQISVEEVVTYIAEQQNSMLKNSGIWYKVKMFFKFFGTASALSRIVLTTPKSTFMNEALVGFGPHFKAPLILVSAQSTEFCNYLVGNEAPSSYVGHLISPFSHPMSFFQRLMNLLINFLFAITQQVLHIFDKPLYEEFFTNKTGFYDALFNVSLIFANTHPSIHEARPIVPSIIEVGGFHVAEAKPLPEDLQKYLDNSPHGVVLFSMGSILKSKDLQPEVKSAIVNSFAKLKQKVLWKFEEELPNLPSNVKIMKWIPQNDVLAHKNTKVFMTHGGNFGSIEAVYHGVPIIGLPVFGDQTNNVQKAVKKGYGLMVPLDELTEETLSAALHEMLSNSSYQANVKQRSNVLLDQPMSPMSTALFWVDYVIRHKGTPYLKVGGASLPFYQKHMFDLYLTLITISVLSFGVFCFVAKKVLRRFCTKKNKLVNSAKKNQ